MAKADPTLPTQEKPITQRRWDLTGRQFGRLTVICLFDRAKYGLLRWRCQCECGNEKIIITQSLKSGHTRSCGCLTIEKLWVHGYGDTRIHSIWRAIHQRCENPNEPGYRNYGGRGIRVCDRWRDFRNLLADMGEGAPGLSIDRIDNDGNYEPGNCRWATKKEQARNTSKNHALTLNGETMCMAAWAERLGLNANTIYQRLQYGWSVERALLAPVQIHRKAAEVLREGKDVGE